MDKSLFGDIIRVTNDIRNGVFAYKDVSVDRVRNIGKNIVDKVLNEINIQFKQIKNKIFNEVSNDLSKLGEIEQKAQNEVTGFFKSIIPGGHL